MKKNNSLVPSHANKYGILYIYPQSVHANGAPKRIDQQLHKRSRRHSLSECLDRLSGPDGPSRPSVPLSACQDCSLASPPLPRCCQLCCLGPFPRPVVTPHGRFFLPRCSLMNAPQRNGSWGASVPLYLQHVGRCGLVYFHYLKIPHTINHVGCRDYSHL